MARTIWKNRSWLRKFAWHRRSASAQSIALVHGLFPEAYFQEKLLQERKRALRSNKPLVVMVLDAESIGGSGRPGKITDSLSEALNGSVRESDICGLLKEDVLVGVILTEVEAEKVGTAQLIVANKTREKLDALLSHEMADRVAITFHIFPAASGSGLLDPGYAANLLARKGQSDADQ
jgi:hypothetical protein